MEVNGQWSLCDSGTVCKMLESSETDGLDSNEVEKRREQYKYNELEEKKAVSPFRIFASQFKDFMVLVLLGAAIVSGLLGEAVDSIAIGAIILINAVLGFIQEYRAEQSMAALREMAAPTAQVIRDGKVQIIAARLLVPGDIIILESGVKVPADARLLDVNNLRVDEAMLTGESKPAKKISARLEKDTIGPADKKNMVFMGTIATDGRGAAVVTETGMKTEMGQIAHMIQAVEEEQTPLQQRLDQLGRWLVLGCLLICVVVALTGILRGEDPLIMLLVGISLAVAAIPEGLPAIVTVSLAIGVQRMIKRHALIRSLPAVETLGCTNFICSDKTGTLTENKMTVRKIYTNGNMFEVTGVGYNPVGGFKRGDRAVDEEEFDQLHRLLEIGTLASNATLIQMEPDGEQNNGRIDGEWTIAGDPTEGAIVVAAAKAGIFKDLLQKECQRKMEIPFDSDRKRMSTTCSTPSGAGIVSVKGAAESLLELCDGIWEGGYIKQMTPDDRQRVIRVNEEMAKGALRVLGIAYKDVADLDDVTAETAESGLIFAGLVGMIDPPRAEAKAAISRCDQAGIKTVMITGDHRLTAEAIGRELDILKKGDAILTGEDLSRMSIEDLSQQVEKVSVYARVSPHHKLNIVKALKGRGHVVAMTGDGVNDAPAVKEAGIGVAMGVTGTDVTKESSSMILMDDNFATIVAAVEEGRAIYDNIRKFIRYLLSCNVGEVLTMFIAALAGLPLPLLPIQILWVNLVTDGLPAIALGLDPSDAGIMDRAPRGSEEHIFSRGLSRIIMLRGLVISIITLSAFIATLQLAPGNLALARTIAFAVLVVSQLIHVFECRSETRGIFEIGVFSNLYLVGAVASSLIMLLAVIYIPTLQPIFRTAALLPGHWAMVVLAGLSGSLLMKVFVYAAQVALGPIPSFKTKRA
jgi:P-type Ca2+ transporter type 2C